MSGTIARQARLDRKLTRLIDRCERIRVQRHMLSLTLRQLDEEIRRLRDERSCLDQTQTI